MERATTPPERLDKGTLLGPYEILAFVGEGGMGEVYRARDTRLDRPVAVKILPAHRSDDPHHQRQRFMREAWILSSLNHPHVCAIHDIGEHEGRAFLVMELVEGESLDARLARRPLPLALTLTLAGQIADALDAAHRRGFVHRDLKPGNIIVTPSGVKLLDFGIAKLWSEPLDTVEQSKVTTASDAASVPGTTAYIAPEQLEGRPADPRSDLFAFGVVLYEMLSGRRPFTAETRAGLIAAILEKSPEPLTLPDGPAGFALERVTFKCLEKDPDARWQTARDLSSELAWIAQQHERSIRPPATLRTAWRRRAIAAAIAASVVVSAGWLWMTSSAVAPPPPVVRFILVPPSGVVMAGSGAFALSPDGRYLAFAGSSDGGPSLLWVQSLDSYTARAIPGTDDAWHPFWSYDSRSVGFFAGRKVKAADTAGGAVRTLADVPQATRASWAAWGATAVVVGAGRSVFRVPTEGGTPVELTLRGAWTQDGRTAFFYSFLPDGRHFLFKSQALEEGDPNVFVASVDDGTVTPLLNADSQVQYVDPGYLLFMRGGDLFAQSFDAGSRRLSGRPMHVAEPVSRSTRLGRAIFSASRSGVLAYEGDAISTQLVWFDRVGRRLGVLGAPGLYTNPALSPDGTRALVSRFDPSVGTSDIWLIDEHLGARAVSSNPKAEDYPVWSADGRKLVYASDRTGRMRMYVKPIDTPAASTEDEMPLNAASPEDDDNWPVDWSTDGRFVLFQGGGRGIPGRLFAIPTSDDEPTPQALFPPKAPSSLDLQQGAQSQVSPDGRWIAYVADLGRSPQVFVKSFSGDTGLAQVSTAGGFEPRWRGDGRELFYLTPDRTVMSVDIRCGTVCQFTAPKPLFRVPGLGAPLRKGSIRNEYAVTRDGNRFLVNEPVDGVSAYAIRIVINWMSALTTKQ